MTRTRKRMPRPWFALCLLAAAPAVADYDYSDSAEVVLDLLSLDPGSVGAWADSSVVGLDLSNMNRDSADSGEIYIGDPPTPAPVPVAVEVPGAVVLNEPFVIRVVFRNNGAPGDIGGISISFPELTATDDNMPPYESDVADVELHAETTFATVGFYDAGDQIDIGGTMGPAQHLSVEGEDAAWDYEETHTLALTVTPKTLEPLTIRIRAWIGEQGTGYGPPTYRWPDHEDIGYELDQQQYWSQVHCTDVFARTLRELANMRNVRFGGAVNHQVKPENDSSDDRQFKLEFDRSFNMATLEDEHKAGVNLPGQVYPLWKGPGEYDFSEADKVVAWCHQHGMTVKYHTLVWTNPHDDVDDGVPDWLLNGVAEGTYDANDVRVMLEAYIEAVIVHYSGDPAMGSSPELKIEHYDVVNEWFSGPEECDGPPRDNWWRDTAGDDVFELTFARAGAAFDSLNTAGVELHGVLIYNDYNLATCPGKTQMALDRLEQLPTPSEYYEYAVGFQCHFVDEPSQGRPLPYLTPAYLRANIKPQFDLFRGTGFDVYVSEFDIYYENFNADRQGWEYENFLMFALSDARVTAFQMWDFWDGAAWRAHTGLFDQAWIAKPSYTGFYDALGALSLPQGGSDAGTALSPGGAQGVPPP